MSINQSLNFLFAIFNDWQSLRFKFHDFQILNPESWIPKSKFFWLVKDCFWQKKCGQNNFSTNLEHTSIVIFQWKLEGQLKEKIKWKLKWFNSHTWLFDYCQYNSIAVLTFDAHTKKIPMLKGVYLIKSWYDWCFLRRQCSGSVGASRAGNPEGGGSSRVGGKMCLLVKMRDWAIGKLQHHFFYNIFDTYI